MRGLLLALLGLLVLAAPAAGQDPVRPGAQGRPIPKPKNGIRMDPGPDGEKPSGPGESGEGGEKPAPEKPADPYEAALAALAGWPSAEAKEAAAGLALLGPEIEEKLVASLAGASPSLTSGIAFVLGEIGGDAALKALQTVAGRPTMVDDLDVVFEALGKLEGLGAVRRVLPFLRHPKRPARASAEKWLASHLDASHAERLEGLLGDASRGARLSAFRLLAGIAPDRARQRAFDLLDDESPEIARTAAELLAAVPDDAAVVELNRIVAAGGGRRAAYATISLALVSDRTGSPVFSEAAVTALTGREGIGAPDKLARGAAAVALADVGTMGTRADVDALLDRQVVDILLDTFGGQTFFKDYASVAELARDRFGRVTGIIERKPVPELWDWWQGEREGFVARRTLLSLDPARPGEFRVRARSLTEPGLPTTLFSNVAADAGRPDTLGIGYVYLLPADAEDLAGLVKTALLSAPDGGAIDPFRAAAGRDPSTLGPEVVITISSDRRSRTVTARRGSLPPPVLAVLAKLRMLRQSYAWQQFWDRGTWPRYADFIEEEAEWFAGDHPPEAIAAHTKELILRSLDDLATTEARTAALDALESLKAPLSDSDAYTLALLLERQDALTPFAEKLVRALARAGRPLVLPILSDWLEGHPGSRSLDLFAEVLARTGPEQVLVAAASDRVYLVRAAMRAAPDVLTGDDLLVTLRQGLREAPEIVCREALLSLGRSGLAEALPLIESALDDAEIGVRNAAVEALGILGRPEVVPVLTRELGSEDFGRRVAAVTALCRSGRSEALGPVLACVRRDPSPAVRAVAAREVVRFGAPALPGLTAIVTDPEESAGARAQAVEALVRVGGDQVAAVLVALLGDPAAEVADSAAFALARRQRKEAVPRLLDALENGRDPIRTVAALEQVSCQSFSSAKAGELPAIYRGWWGEQQQAAEAEWFREALEARGYDVTELATLGASDPSATTVPVLIRVLLDGGWHLRANANLWLQRVAVEDFGEVTRFSSAEEVREVYAKWQAWWEGR